MGIGNSKYYAHYNYQNIIISHGYSILKKQFRKVWILEYYAHSISNYLAMHNNCSKFSESATIPLSNVSLVQSANGVVMNHLKVDLVAHQFTDVAYAIFDHGGPIVVCLCAVKEEAQI